MKKNNPFTDATVIRDMSGGSGANTWLMEDFNHNLFVRKWGHGSVGKKILDQATWLSENNRKILCPTVLNTGSFEQRHWVDLEFVHNSNTSFEQVHAEHNLIQSHKIISTLNSFVSSAELTAANEDSRQYYFRNKFISNIESASLNNPEIQIILNSKKLKINQITYSGIKSILKSEKIQSTLKLFSKEPENKGGHGDLTLSNLLWSPQGIFFIDPNKTSEKITSTQELGKILQSSLTQYELIHQGTSVDDNFFSSKPSFTPESRSWQLTLCQSENVKNFNFDLKNSLLFKGYELDLIELQCLIHLARMLPYIDSRKSWLATTYVILIAVALNAIETKQPTAEALRLVCKYN